MSSICTRDLVAERYGVLASPKPCTFLIIKPIEGVYEVNPAAHSCTCAAGQKGRSCCHLTQLRDLLRSESRRMLALSKTTEDVRHAAQLVCEVEALVKQWKEVKAARPTSVLGSVLTAPRRYAIYGQLQNKAWVSVLRGFTDEAEAQRQRGTIGGNFYRQTSVRPDRSFVPGVA